MRRSIYLFVLVGILLLGACGTNETGSPTSSVTDAADPGSGRNQTQGAAPKDPAPDFTVTTFEGEAFSLGEQRGTPVVLNFWESW